MSKFAAPWFKSQDKHDCYSVMTECVFKTVMCKIEGIVYPDSLLSPLT